MTETEKENLIYCFCGNNFADVLHCFLGERPSRDEDLCQIPRRLGNPALPANGILLRTHLCLQSPRTDQSLLQKLPGPAGLQGNASLLNAKEARASCTPPGKIDIDKWD